MSKIDLFQKSSLVFDLDKIFSIASYEQQSIGSLKRHELTLKSSLNQSCIYIGIITLNLKYTRTYHSFYESQPHVDKTPESK